MADKLINIFKRELKLIAKDINIITIIILAPVFYSLFYGSIYVKKVERELPVVVYDEDKTETSKAIARLLDAHQMITISGAVTDFQSGANEINKNSAYGMIYIPKNFESDLKLRRGATLKTYLNTTRFLISNDINMAVNETIIDYNSSIKLKFFEQSGYSFSQAKELIEPVKFDVRPMFNTTESYGEFLIPGIFILIIQQTLLIGLSESVAKEQEENLTGDLYGASGGSIFSIIHGKGLLYALIYGAFSFFFFTFNYRLFDMQIAGSGLILSLFTLLLIISTMYLAIFIGSYFNRKIIAVQFLTLSTYPVFLISGYSWPTASMPVWIQYIAKIIPSTPYLSAFVKITRMDAGAAAVVPELIHLILLTLILYLATHFRLKSFFKKLKSN